MSAVQALRLTQAADAVEHWATGTTTEPWVPDFHYELPCRCGDCPDDGAHVIHVSAADQYWFCLLDPGLAPVLVELLRHAAEREKASMDADLGIHRLAERLLSKSAGLRRTKDKQGTRLP